MLKELILVCMGCEELRGGVGIPHLSKNIGVNHPNIFTQMQNICD